MQRGRIRQFSDRENPHDRSCPTLCILASCQTLVLTIAHGRFTRTNSPIQATNHLSSSIDNRQHLPYMARLQAWFT
jgi:hypothetical protein